MRRKDETLRASLLDCARSIAEAEGTAAINIRRIAREASIATGTVYLYFSGKDDILLALTEEYWRQALLDMESAVTAAAFPEQLGQIFSFLSNRLTGSAGMLMRSLGNAEAAGRERMRTTQRLLRDALVRRMTQCGDIRADIWNETFSPEAYGDFLVGNLLLLLQVRGQGLDFFLALVRRTLAPSLGMQRYETGS